MERNDGCGNEVTVILACLRRGDTTSCGCYHKEQAAKFASSTVKHGHYIGNRATPTYRSWQSMLRRCMATEGKHYRDYVEKGVKVCEEWKTSFTQFLQDMGARPIGMTLDRINPAGNYEPCNCRWATILEQRHNRRPEVKQ